MVTTRRGRRVNTINIVRIWPLNSRASRLFDFGTVNISCFPFLLKPRSTIPPLNNPPVSSLIHYSSFSVFYGPFGFATMRFRHLLTSLALAPIALAAPRFAAPSLFKRCTNSADDRSCWGDYDISTNYYDESPDTGVVREYWFDIVNTTAAPDGIERVVLSINGTVPGPTIIADWGDTVGEFSHYDSIFLLSLHLHTQLQAAC